MVRLSKQTRRRSVNYKRPKVSVKKTTQKNTQNEYKAQANALTGDQAFVAFIPKCG